MGQTKTNFILFFQEFFVFVWPIRGVNQNKNILQGVNQKKKFTGGKTKNDLYYGGKDLLTFKTTKCKLSTCKYRIRLL